MKLGHPSLIKCANARIAGEINFDMNAATPGWVISNKSGRYGLRKSTTQAHLDNIVSVFSKYGITLTPYFIQGNR